MLFNNALIMLAHSLFICHLKLSDNKPQNVERKGPKKELWDLSFFERTKHECHKYNTMLSMNDATYVVVL